MIPIRGIVICVGYDDILALTLLPNMRHLVECLVITSPPDTKTKRLVSQIPNARSYVTDAFYRHGAKFNKGLAMEEGFDAHGREGWILIWDADILLPDRLPLSNLDRDTLYGAPRRVLNDPRLFRDGFDWQQAPVDVDPTFPGYFQLFHSSSKYLLKRPWYGLTYTHAGGGDAEFDMRFKQKKKLPLEVLHIGPRDRNWFGRTSERLDGEAIPEAKERAGNMLALQRSRGIGGQRRTAQPFNDRVNVE